MTISTRGTTTPKSTATSAARRATIAERKKRRGIRGGRKTKSGSFGRKGERWKRRRSRPKDDVERRRG